MGKVFVRVFAVAALLLAGEASTAFAAAGELQGKVIEVGKHGRLTVFRMTIESQHIYSKHAPLASPAQMLYSGERMDEIKAGQTLHVWFNGKLNRDCKPCGLNATRIDFPDGTTVFHAESQTQPVIASREVPAKFGPPWWIEPMRMASGMLVFVIAIAGLYCYVRRVPGE